MESMGAVVFMEREGEAPSLLLEKVLFDPAAVWLAEALKEQGVTRFLVVCHADDRAAAADCFPQDTLFITNGAQEAARSSAFLNEMDTVIHLTKPLFPAGDEDAAQGAVRVSGEARRALQGMQPALTETSEGKGVSPVKGFVPLTRDALYEEIPAIAQARRATQLRRAGVRVLDGQSTFVGPAVTVGRGTVLLPGTILRGKTSIGADCEIGPNTMIRDCTVGSGVTVNASQLNESIVEDGAAIGPFAYVRPHCHVGREVKVGDFVELKNSVIGAGTKISHLTYVGDADVGERVNFGCGTVTVNYDGDGKFRTVIGDDAFIGCNTNLVAPVQVGAAAYTAAGSTITQDVPPQSLAIARAHQTVKKQWKNQRRERK